MDSAVNAMEGEAARLQRSYVLPLLEAVHEPSLLKWPGRQQGGSVAAGVTRVV